MPTASLPQSLIALDHRVWYYLNVRWRNEFLDAVIPYFRNQWTWAPLYLFLLVFLVGNFKKKGWLWCLFFLLTFALADRISAGWIKEIFQRTRPCNDLSLAKMVYIIVPCGSGYSFPSTHAANHFALGTFAALTLQKHVKGVWWMAMFWAASVSYAQVYVGVHFPLDIFCGALLGLLIGMCTGMLFNLKFRL
jgi:undecaprenyl-diphosphatase